MAKKRSVAARSNKTAKVYAAKGGNKITRALNTITPRPNTGRTVIPSVMPSSVGNMGDSAPASKLRNGMF